jgi:hypothetical protein
MRARSPSRRRLAGDPTIRRTKLRASVIDELPATHTSGSRPRPSPRANGAHAHAPRRPGQGARRCRRGLRSRRARRRKSWRTARGSRSAQSMRFDAVIPKRAALLPVRSDPLLCMRSLHIDAPTPPSDAPRVQSSALSRASAAQQIDPQSGQDGRHALPLLDPDGRGVPDRATAPAARRTRAAATPAVAAAGNQPRLRRLLGGAARWPETTWQRKTTAVCGRKPRRTQRPTSASGSTTSPVSFVDLADEGRLEGLARAAAFPPAAPSRRAR